VYDLGAAQRLYRVSNRAQNFAPNPIGRLKSIASPRANFSL
jgi:hypothetical protein